MSGINNQDKNRENSNVSTPAETVENLPADDAEAVNEASFFDVEAYNQVAEYCSKKATKGRGVRVVGRLKQDTWKDTSGKTASRIYVVAEHIEYKPEKKTNENEEKASATAETTEQVAVEEKQAEPVPVEEAAVF